MWLATWNRHPQHYQMLKIETDRLPIGLIMAVADVLETRITRHVTKGQKSQNYLNHESTTAIDTVKMIST